MRQQQAGRRDPSFDHFQALVDFQVEAIDPSALLAQPNNWAVKMLRARSLNMPDFCLELSSAAFIANRHGVLLRCCRRALGRLSRGCPDSDLAALVF